MSLSTSYFKRSPLVIAISLALASPTFAESFIIADGDTETVQKQLINGQTGVIEVGGTLNTTEAAIVAFGTGNTITNSGVITNSSSSTTAAIESQGTGNTITNSGSITAGLVGIYSTATATNAKITNSGTIDATAGIYGIDSSGAKATITNTSSGTIDANINGIRSQGINAKITNSGTIDAVGNGIYSSGADAIITNSGTIDAGQGGIVSSGDDAIITNSGTITATFVGIFSYGANATINNSGHITGTSYAVYGLSPIFKTTNSLTLNLLKGSQLMGAIDLGGDGTDNDTVNIHGGSVSATLTFKNTENINLLGPGLKLSGDVVVSVDGTAEAARSVTLLNITGDIHNQIAQRTNQPAPLEPVNVASSTLLPGMYFKQYKPLAWAQVFGGEFDRDAEGDARAYDHDYVGINYGYEWDQDQRRVGLVAGIVKSDTKGNESSFKSDSNQFYLGAYANQQLQGFTLTTSLLTGYGRHDNKRLVIDNLNGREVAKSDFSSVFISPSLTVASAYTIYDSIELRPSASINYSIAWLDDYSERGTSQSNLSVDDRKIQALAAKLQLAAAYDYSATTELELRAGLNSRHSNDDDTQISIGASQAKFANVGDESVSGGFVGARLRIIGSDKLSLIADVELGGNGDEDYKAGNLSIEYSF